MRHLPGPLKRWRCPKTFRLSTGRGEAEAEQIFHPSLENIAILVHSGVSLTRARHWFGR
jgi:hypothetical protein